ncbi:heterokaryon incompatibility protein-domain-containing protein [Podospora aff. communis PSN243]|uniref:Heterokaryon incompatibility protein-domain-containing protein n=1 Tax=Podospora aff. communis PSN243 TaxID=3040156 RepID=A0AAV9FZ70_9PEZI|nr:heterokaryon incompatibility protein-domain-containing protein [Podospora aff. communis PSN243]
MSSLRRASTYRHAPIDTGRDTIRLIRLKKGHINATISCELFLTSLSEDRGFPYEALSYTWGSSDPVQAFLDHDETQGAEIEKPVSIVVNNLNFYVAPNLYLALRHLRDVETDRILWVDAICIDQDNDREKGHQVGMMRRIFEQSKGVVVWLGEGSANTDFFMDMVAEIWAVWQQTNSTNRVKTALQRLRRRRGDRLRFEDVSLGASIQDILGRPWFTRVWVIQEVASANTGLVVCGAKSHPCDIFASVTTFLLDQEPVRNALGRFPGVLQTRKALLDVMPGPNRASSWWTKDRTLGTLLAKFHHSQASNPRDNTYALLGISSDACDPAKFPPDYTKTVDEVIRDTAAFLIFRSLDSPAVSQAIIFGPQALRLLYRRGTLQYRALEWAMGTGSAEVVRAILRNEIFGLPDQAIEVFMVRYVELTSAGAHYDAARGHGDPKLNSMLLSLATKTGEEFSVRTFLRMGVSPFEINGMGG